MWIFISYDLGKVDNFNMKNIVSCGGTNKANIKKSIIYGVCDHFVPINSVPVKSSDMVSYLGILGEKSKKRIIL